MNAGRQEGAQIIHTLLQVLSAHLQIPGHTDPDPSDAPPTGGTIARGGWESGSAAGSSHLAHSRSLGGKPSFWRPVWFWFCLFFFIVSLTVCIVSIWEDLLSDFIRRVLRLRWLGTHLSCWALVKVASPSDVAGSPLEVVGSTPEPHRRCPGTGATPWGPAQHRPESSARFVPSSSHPEWTLPSMDLQPAWTRTPCRPHSVVTLSLMTSDLPQ